MGVFDRFSEKKGDDIEVYPETQDFGEGVVSSPNAASLAKVTSS